MKTYEKPRLMALSLSGNERLCGDCAQRGASLLLYQDKEIAAFLMELYGFGSGDPDASDFVGVFGLTEQCSKKIVGFCKYSSLDETGQTVAWS